ncbi:MAG: substrate-binding domain-containing protein [Leptolyngbyaceae cyanobacterium MO_188.B28]|nr:substrate-binding domain-containing protein [Leptolyngbyaceae cyanobacterium MO_188.B28]
MLFRSPFANLGETSIDETLDKTASPTPSNPSRGAQANSSGGDESWAFVSVSRFTEVDDVPAGLFSYGGSTTWDPLRVKGEPLIETAWPDFQLRYMPPVVGFPGSDTSIRMLLDGQLAFALSSRPLNPEEHEEAKQRGVRLEQIAVAIADIAIAVNPDLDIPGLTIDTLRGIYTGRITNWSQVNGPDVPIMPYSRSPEVGGTPTSFIETVLVNEELGSKVELVDDTTEGLRKVADNLGGIYYASFPEVLPQCSTKPIPIARNSNESFVPSYQEPLVLPEACPDQRNQLNFEAVKSGDYPLSRRLFVIVKKDGKIDQQVGEAYARLILTDQGQQLVREVGFVNLTRRIFKLQGD